MIQNEIELRQQVRQETEKSKKIIYDVSNENSRIY